MKKFIAVASMLFAGSAFADLEYDNSFNKALAMAKSGNSPVRSQDYSRDAGGWSMKSVVNRDATINWRTEGVPSKWGLNDSRRMQWGRDYWLGFSVLLPESWKTSTKPIPNRDVNKAFGYTIVAQIHSSSSGHGGPPWSLHVESGKWRMQNRFGKSYTVADVEDTIGKWQDIVIHMKPSMGKDGVMELWFNGKYLGKSVGQNTFSGDERGPFYKFGQYNCWREPTCQKDIASATVYHDVFKIASGPNAKLEDVAPWQASSPQ